MMISSMGTKYPDKMYIFNIMENYFTRLSYFSLVGICNINIFLGMVERLRLKKLEIPIILYKTRKNVQQINLKNNNLHNNVRISLYVLIIITQCNGGKKILKLYLYIL